MNFYQEYKSPFGYQTGTNGIDSYGVDHRGFDTRDELEYQTARNTKERRLANDLQRQGIGENDYPQYGTDFWGNSENNYGFGIRNIGQNVQNHPAMNMTPMQISPHNQQTETNVISQQKNHGIGNDLLMSGMDTLYGMNRTINGMTFGGLDYLGNKFGFDSKMNGYLNLKDERNQKVAQVAGKVAEIGGGMLSGGAVAKATYEPANMMYQGYKIGKAYDKLKQNPYAGNGGDVIARMKNHNGEPVVLQRGEAIPGENGSVITSGRPLQHQTGTARNYGLNKIIYKHDVPRNEVVKIPRYIKNNQPVEVNARGQHIYKFNGGSEEIKLSTTPVDKRRTVSSMYRYIAKK